MPRILNYRRNEVESCVANAHRGVNAVTLSTVPFVGFRDRDQYIQRPSDTLPSDTPPAAFFISSQINYGEPSNNGPSSLSGESQFPPPFPQPQCSCVPSSLGNQPPGSRSSLPYAQETAESSLPQTLPSYQRPEFSDGTVDDNGVIVPSTVTDPVASPNTVGGLIAEPLVTINVPATVTSPVASLDTASTAGGQITAPLVYIRSPGTFGGTTPDPFSIRARFGRDIADEPVAEAPPEVPKPGVWSKFLRIFK